MKKKKKKWNEKEINVLIKLWNFWGGRSVDQVQKFLEVCDFSKV